MRERPHARNPSTNLEDEYFCIVKKISNFKLGIRVPIVPCCFKPRDGYIYGCARRLDPVSDLPVKLAFVGKEMS